jgi:hypothetical protein
LSFLASLPVPLCGPDGRVFEFYDSRVRFGSASGAPKYHKQRKDIGTNSESSAVTGRLGPQSYLAAGTP